MQNSTSTCSGRRKAQSAFEFIFIFGLFLSALIVGMWTYFIKTNEVSRYNFELGINELMAVVSEKINTVWIEGKGFSTNITIPETLSSMYYEINITSNYVILTTGGERYIQTMITKNVTGSLKKGVNTLYNRGGYIEII
ncbi:MAG: hypothetical protein JW789_00135 [Candidatus Aenigmarchaeota archaeon]|nr:hypothetical protein [Candidatus Aenigmarchaeota archaeon]